MNKIIDSAALAIKDIHDGATIMSGGFGLCGNPENLINALHEKGINNLTVISNNCGAGELGLGILLKDRRIKKMISSYVGENKNFESQFLGGDLEVELVPQGTLAERIRAGGAGIAAFFTKTGVHTMVSEGGLPMRYDKDGNVIKTSEKKEVREFYGSSFVLEKALHADYALIKAKAADPFGNLVFNKAARNFNPEMAKAARTTIVEVEEIVDLGDLNPECIQVPGAYVDKIILGHNYQKWIEQKTIRQKN